MKVLGAAATRIAALLKTGGRKRNVLEGLLVRSAGASARARERRVFHEAVGQLFLEGMIVNKGRTSARLICLNGRRSGKAFRRPKRAAPAIVLDLSRLSE